MVSNCEFVTFPLVSWVRCGTGLYRFLIFAPLLTSNRKYLVDGFTFSPNAWLTPTYPGDFGAELKSAKSLSPAAEPAVENSKTLDKSTGLDKQIFSVKL